MDEMIELGEQVFFGEYTDENGARRMLKEAAKKICPGIDESRIKLIIKEDRGYITGAWYVQVKEKEYIRMLEAQNAELVRKTEQLERERDALENELYSVVNDYVTPCFCCKIFEPSTTVCDHEGVDCFIWRGVQEQPEEGEHGTNKW